MTDDDADDSALDNSIQSSDELTDSDMASMSAAMRSAGLGSMLEETPVAIEEVVEVSSQQESDDANTSGDNLVYQDDEFPELEDVDDNEEMVKVLLNVGEERSRKSDAKGALAAFNKAIALDPSCDMAWFNRGVLLEAQKDARGAKQAFQICLDLNPDHAPATANLASVLERMGDLIEAYKVAQKALVFYPGHPALIEISNRCKDSEVNIPIAEVPRIIAETHTYDESTVVAVMDEVGIDDMEAVLQEAVHHDHDRDLNLDYSELKSAATVVAATEEVLVRLEAKPVISAQPVEEVAVPEAEEVVQQPVEEVISQPVTVEEEVIEQPEIDIESLVEEATELIRSGDAAGGLSILKPHLKTIAAENANAWRVAGGAMARLDLDTHAIAAITHAQTLDPSNSSGWFNLGSIYQRGDDFSEAKKCYLNALDAQPDYLKAASKLSDLSKQMSDVESYLFATRIIAMFEPSDARVMEMAEVLIEIAEGEANVLDSTQGLPPTIPVGPEMAQEALGIIGEGVSILHARAYTAISDHHNAVTTWKALIQSDGENPANWRGLARSLEEAGDIATAQKCHAKANEMDNGVESVTVETPLPVEQTEIPQVAELIPQELAPVVVEQPIAEIADSPANILLEPIAPVEVLEPAHEENKSQANDLLMAPIEPRPVNVETVEDQKVDLAKAALDATHAASLNIIGETSSKSVANQDVAWYNKGIQLIEDGKYREALTCFDRALPSFKDDDEMVIRILNGRGNSYYYMEEYPKCVEAYHQAMLIRPTEVRGQTLYNMGTAYAEMERYPDAIKCFEQSIPRGLSTSEAKRAKDQIRRCTILNKERMRKIRKKS
ncbi:MAG: tetratricopeptide repeat protein [Candidatus Poseidoniaceae archaeon]|nr:tetratricopeptide repeat protein [Candidatus Poseidoniaceae archaeon]